MCHCYEETTMTKATHGGVFRGFEFQRVRFMAGNKHKHQAGVNLQWHGL